MQTLQNAILVAIGTFLIGLVLYYAGQYGNFGTLMVIGITVIGVVALGIPVFMRLDDHWRRNSQDKITGADYASRQAFIREIKQVSLDHAAQVERLAVDLGRSEAVREAAEKKIDRMTSRPKLNGRIIKKQQAAALGIGSDVAPPPAFIDYTELLGPPHD